jgi:hypothetical protein
MRSVRFELETGDSRVARLADENLVLAVRAREENSDAVDELLTDHGSEKVTDVDERSTRRVSIRWTSNGKAPRRGRLTGRPGGSVAGIVIETRSGALPIG